MSDAPRLFYLLLVLDAVTTDFPVAENVRVNLWERSKFEKSSPTPENIAATVMLHG